MTRHVRRSVFAVLSFLVVPSVVLFSGIQITYGADVDRINYLLHCRGCHTPTGAAVPAADVPSLRELGPLLKSSEARRYMIQVPGVAHTPLTNEQVAGVLNWIVVNFNSESNIDDFDPFTTEEVRSARESILANPNKARSLLNVGSRQD